jgi:hypothetical protein
MVTFGEKAKIKKAGNLNLGRSYVITSVIGRRNMTAYDRMKFNLGRLQNLGIGYITGYITCEICINPKSDVGYYIFKEKLSYLN